MQNQHFNLSDFKLEKAVIEFRYPSAFLHWDCAGAIWTEALIKWPSLKNISAEPAKTIFTLEDRTEFTIQINQSHVIEQNPESSLKNFINNTSLFFKLTTHKLEIQKFNRIGFRLIYFKEYPNKDDATAAFLSTGMIKIPRSSPIINEGKPMYPECAIRWEGNALGCNVRIRSEGRRFDFDPPFGIEDMKPIHKEKNGLVFDVDYYTIGLVTIGQFQPEEWIKQAIHLIRRDTKNFFEEI